MNSVSAFLIDFSLLFCYNIIRYDNLGVYKMKRVKKTSELLWLFGIIFVALGVTICSKADLGVSMIAAPAFILSEKLMTLSSFFTVGVTEYLLQGVLLAVMCIVLKKFDLRYLLAFAVAVIYGYTLDFFIFIFDGVVFDQIWLRWVMLIVGDIVTALGVACFFRTYMPLQVYELFVSEISKNFKISLDKTKRTFDYSLLLISIVLSVVLFIDLFEFDWSAIGYTSFHSIGLGTLVTTLINSVLIMLAGKLLDSLFDPTPLIPKLSDALKVK